MPAFSCAVRGPPAAGAGARRGLRAASSGGLRVRSLFVRRRRARRRACCSGCFPHVAHGHATKKWWQGALTKIGMDGRLYCTPDTGRYPNLARPCVCVCVCQHEDARGPGPHPTGQGTATRAGPCIFDLDSSTYARDSRESLTAVQSESRERSWATNITEFYLMHTVIMYMATLASLQRKPHARIPPPTRARLATRQPRSTRRCRTCACAAAP